jgi:hypothetical protein
MTVLAAPAGHIVSAALVEIKAAIVLVWLPRLHFNH